MDVRDALVLGDPFRIGQVMNNLLSNAVKFTREGDSICVNVSQMEATSGEFCKYRLMIADTGIGMSADYLPHLFEPYSREMRFGERQAVGTGLGMPITRSIVTQMNGEIHVESAPGKGTTFTIILPFAIVHKERLQENDKTDGEEILTSERQLSAVLRAIEKTDEAISALEDGIPADCVISVLNEAWSALGEITGQTVSEKIIDDIFDKFCVGK